MTAYVEVKWQASDGGDPRRTFIRKDRIVALAQCDSEPWFFYVYIDHPDISRIRVEGSELLEDVAEVRL